jgi:hypothetical protein
MRALAPWRTLFFAIKQKRVSLLFSAKKKLVDVRKEAGLEIDEETAKFMFMSRHQNAGKLVINPSNTWQSSDIWERQIRIAFMIAQSV